MVDPVHLTHHALAWLQTAPPSPAPKSDSSSGQTASLAALIASLTGLVTAIGAIILGLRKRDQVANPMADKAIEYLIKQNKELLKERRQPIEELVEKPVKPRRRS